MGEPRELRTEDSSARAGSEWDEERTDRHRTRPKALSAMGVDHERWWRYVNHHLLRRRFDLRRLIITVIAIIGVSMVVFEVTHHELYRLAPFQRPVSENSEPPRVPGQCTTWPVSAEGHYTPIHRNGTANFELESFAPKGGWKKPIGIKIVALVFYGRKRTVDFLDCYLLQNLAANGGYLDEIRFMVHTNKEDDVSYLKDLVSKREEYYRIVEAGACEGTSFGCIWDSVVEDDTIYVKIDDDIIFIHPDAIPQLVHTRIATPHPFAVSANLVNSPLTGYEHYHVGAIHPFRPDPRSKPAHTAAESWRPSEKSLFPSSSLPELNVSDLDSIAMMDEIFPARSYEGHPFLLLSNNPYDLLQSPMGLNFLRGGEKGVEAMYEAAWKSWAIAAQQQYSLLRNLEDNAMARYFFGAPLTFAPGSGANVSAAALKHLDGNAGAPGAEQLYDTQYKRYNLNFVALWGHDVRAALPIAEDDEQDITVTIPKRTRRPFVIDTRSVVGHLSFYPQHDGVRETDLLDRWRAFANEMVCAPANRKVPFDERCPGF
ncbi:Mitochondrial-processing peptidase subunit alpha [Parahypoxylon ruwenzoriense]